jgi:hypothetical protein
MTGRVPGAMAMPTTEGGCLCGSVRYEVRGDLSSAYYCHCSRCRKTSGSAFTSNAVVSPSDFVVTHGREALRRYTSAEGISRVFCSNCGSHIFVAQGNQMRLRLGSLDAAPGVVPQMHIFTGSKAAWFSICDELPQYLERPKANSTPSLISRPAE